MNMNRYLRTYNENDIKKILVQLRFLGYNFRGSPRTCDYPGTIFSKKSDSDSSDIFEDGFLPKVKYITLNTEAKWILWLLIESDFNEIDFLMGFAEITMEELIGG